MSTLAGKRFILVTGKGGVGKTTVCAAHALALSASGRRVLVAMCNAKERLSTMLGSAPIGPDIVQVAQRVWAVNITPERALQEYGTLVLRSRALSKTIFDNRYAHAFLRAVPGMQEWSMLGKAWWHTTEKSHDGSFKYDTVILDAPATGHGLDMLRVPKVILDVMPPGLLRRDAERAWALFQDRSSSAIVVVTMPEEMPISETIELARGLDAIGLSVGCVVANAVVPPLFSAVERASLVSLSSFEVRSRGDAAIGAAIERARREGVQAESLSRLSTELGLAPVVLPLLFRDAATPDAIRELALHV
ncbi:MAG: ArsA family ATPase [Polyangiaceae bacterium]|jgi:anion-transporting  ArsA/GET3 family ATPase